MQRTNSLPDRLYYLDWLRVIAILMVFVFHASRFFDQYGWHVKNPVTYASVQFGTTFFSIWGMPLMFVISGASLYFSVNKPRKFVKDKTMRLLVPYLVGIFSHVALGVYLERVTNHQFIGSFFDFIPHYFSGWYGFGGNFAWMGLHLWYLLLLYVYSLLFLPLFYLLKGPWNKALAWLGKFFSLPGTVYLLAIPIMALVMSINPATTLGTRNFGGWSVFGYVPFLLYGFLFVSHDGLQRRLRDTRWISLALAILCTVILVYVNDLYGNDFFGTPGNQVLNALFGLDSWFWILAMFGFGIRYLNFANPFLFLANEAVLPVYILHQTVLLCVGYYVVQWNIPDFAKFLIIFLVSFTIVIGLYYFLIRRFNLLRVLFGLKPLKKELPGRISQAT